MSYKHYQRVSLVEDDFEAIGSDFDACACDYFREGQLDHSNRRLLATISINGTAFHVEAIAVYRDPADHIQKGECLSWEERLESFSACFEPDGGWSTVRLFGKDYVLLIEPYSD